MAEVRSIDAGPLRCVYNALCVFVGRLVVHAVNDHQIEAGNNQQIMSARASCSPVAGAAASSAAPHSPQKRSPGSLAAPQAGQADARGFPHSAQNFRPSRFSVPQLGQSIGAEKPSP